MGKAISILLGYLYWCPRPDQSGTEIFFFRLWKCYASGPEAKLLWPIQKNHKLSCVLKFVHIAIGGCAKLLWKGVKGLLKTCE